MGLTALCDMRDIHWPIYLGQLPPWTGLLY